MPIVGISLTKETAFRDSIQQFSNVYYYNNGTGGVPDEAAAMNMIDEVATFEKTIHSSAVEFVYARLWWQTLTELGTTMIAQKSLTGTGSRAPVTGMDKERAFLFRRRAGTDSRGQPVYLRKFFHSCGEIVSGTAQLSSSILANLTAFTSAQRDAQVAMVQGMSNIAAGGGGWVICAKSGRGPTMPNWEAHRFLEHHQLGDQWRGA
jgi:hypothetical protein